MDLRATDLPDDIDALKAMVFARDEIVRKRDAQVEPIAFLSSVVNDLSYGDAWALTLKSELIYHQRFATREQARLAIAEYIEMFYNRQRTQARLNYLSPAAFTRRFHLDRTAA